MKDDQFTDEQEASLEDEHKRAVVCPVCGMQVNNHAAEEIYSVDIVESDFRVRTLDDDILDNWLVFCHNCLYVTHDFSVTPREMKEIRNIVYSDNYQQRFTDTNPTTMELFDHYIYILKKSGAMPMDFADTYLRMSWLFADDSDETTAAEYREKAIVNFAKALLVSNPNEKDTSMIYYYIGELSRRNGQFDRAKKALLKMNMEMPMFRRLFDFQMALIRDKNKAAVAMPREEH
ncbi:MAG: DUF2225 domain-containing protein [Fidelibacterota bacterium]